MEALAADVGKANVAIDKHELKWLLGCACAGYDSGCVNILRVDNMCRRRSQVLCSISSLSRVVERYATCKKASAKMITKQKRISSTDFRTVLRYTDMRMLVSGRVFWAQHIIE